MLMKVNKYQKGGKAGKVFITIAANGRWYVNYLMNLLLYRLLFRKLLPRVAAHPMQAQYLNIVEAQLKIPQDLKEYQTWGYQKDLFSSS